MADRASRVHILRALARPDDWDKLRIADVLYVCHDADRTYNLDGRWYAPVVDTIQDVLSTHGLRGLTVAAPYSILTGAKAHGNVLGFNRSFARSRLPRVLGGTSRSGMETWAPILAAVRPRGVIAVQPSRGLCEAGKRAGVWVADAQHGWIPSTEFPGEPYYTRNYWSVSGDDPFPDHFLVWDDASAQNLHRVFSPRPVKALRTGNMWCERFARKDPSDPIVRDAVPRLSPERPSILVTLQWKTVTVDDSLPAALQRVIGNTCSRYQWIIRLHPCHTSGKAFTAVKQSLHAECGEGIGGVTWSAPTDIPLPALLSVVDLHITYNSSAALEASYFNVMTGFVDRRAAVLQSGMSHLFEQRLAEVIPEDPDSLAEWIHRQIAKRPQRRDVTVNPPDFAASRLRSLFELHGRKLRA